MRRILLFLAVLLATATQAERPKIGLVLGGGGAKGAAEVGALKVLEQAGVKPDFVAGTSIGAIVGGLYAAGYSAAELDTMFCQQAWLSLLTDRREDLSLEPYKTVDGVTYVFGFPVYSSRPTTGIGALRGEKIVALLDSMMGIRQVVDFSDLRVPFKCVAAEIATASEVVLGEGKLAEAMRASMAIPGVFKPVQRGGTTLVDGGMMNNLPVDVVRAMGADVVIAIDLTQSKPVHKEVPFGAFLSMLGGLGDWIVSRPDITKYYENLEHADIYINPGLADYDASSFGNKNMRRMIEAGERAATEKLGEIKQKLGL